jgi:hypothetical protein
MSNVNTFAGVYNVPAQLITTGTATALLVPASGYPGYPSPLFPKNSGLSIAPPADITTGTLDGRPFKVRCSGIYNTGTSSTFLMSFAQVSSANVGVIGAAGGVTSTGVLGTGATVIGAGTVGTGVTGAGSFSLEATLIWDSTSKQLSGNIGGPASFVNASGQISTFTPITVTTRVASLNFVDLNFLATFTFGSSNAANSVTVTEFILDRA